MGSCYDGRRDLEERLNLVRSFLFYGGRTFLLLVWGARPNSFYESTNLKKITPRSGAHATSMMPRTVGSMEIPQNALSEYDIEGEDENGFASEYDGKEERGAPFLLKSSSSRRLLAGRDGEGEGERGAREREKRRKRDRKDRERRERVECRSHPNDTSGVAGVPPGQVWWDPATHVRHRIIWTSPEELDAKREAVSGVGVYDAQWHTHLFGPPNEASKAGRGGAGGGSEAKEEWKKKWWWQSKKGDKGKGGAGAEDMIQCSKTGGGRSILSQSGNGRSVILNAPVVVEGKKKKLLRFLNTLGRKFRRKGEAPPLSILGVREGSPTAAAATDQPTQKHPQPQGGGGEAKGAAGSLGGGDAKVGQDLPQQFGMGRTDPMKIQRGSGNSGAGLSVSEGSGFRAGSAPGSFTRARSGRGRVFGSPLQGALGVGVYNSPLLQGGSTPQESGDEQQRTRAAERHLDEYRQRLMSERSAYSESSSGLRSQRGSAKSPAVASAAAPSAENKPKAEQVLSDPSAQRNATIKKLGLERVVSDPTAQRAGGDGGISSTAGLRVIASEDTVTVRAWALRVMARLMDWSTKYGTRLSTPELDWISDAQVRIVQASYVLGKDMRPVYVIYLLRVQMKNQVWFKFRRYKQLNEFHAKIQRLAREHAEGKNKGGEPAESITLEGVPNFPGKTLGFHCTDDKVVRKRIAMINSYLTALLQRNGQGALISRLLQSKHADFFKSFFGVEDRFSPRLLTRGVFERACAAQMRMGSYVCRTAEEAREESVGREEHSDDGAGASAVGDAEGAQPVGARQKLPGLHSFGLTSPRFSLQRGGGHDEDPRDFIPAELLRVLLEVLFGSLPEQRLTSVCSLCVSRTGARVSSGERRRSSKKRDSEQLGKRGSAGGAGKRGSNSSRMSARSSGCSTGGWGEEIAAARRGGGGVGSSEQRRNNVATALGRELVEPCVLRPLFSWLMRASQRHIEDVLQHMMFVCCRDIHGTAKALLRAGRAQEWLTALAMEVTYARTCKT